MNFQSCALFLNLCGLIGSYLPCVVKRGILPVDTIIVLCNNPPLGQLQIQKCAKIEQGGEAVEECSFKFSFPTFY